ncbi:hypothetical protein O3P69_016046 [Scylla paramamosain]|uniref:Uncharacterized protein n=1 Tax=Scylla paramamosain TaxID=85552 RepID=A0AAW0T8U7_SCYPA
MTSKAQDSTARDASSAKTKTNRKCVAVSLCSEGVLYPQSSVSTSSRYGLKPTVQWLAALSCVWVDRVRLPLVACVRKHQHSHYVTISYGGKRPQRVRVVAKDRGALLFPYRRKLASIPLYKAGWTRLPGDLWRNEQAMAVPVDMAKLLKYKNLALQLYCLRGSDVKHKGVFNLRRVMAQQQQEDEVFLAMRYSALCWWHRLTFGCCRKAADDEAVPVVVRGGGEVRGRDAGDGGLVNMWRGVPASGTPALSQATSLASVPAPAADSPATGAMEQLGELPPPRPVRFPDSGAVFPQLLREHDLGAAEVGTRQQAEEGPPQQRGPWRHGRLARGVVAALGTAGGLAVAAGTLVAGQDAPLVHWLVCGLAAALALAYAFAHARVRRRRRRGRSRGPAQPPGRTALNTLADHHTRTAVSMHINGTEIV